MVLVGDRVIYGVHGICDVKDLEETTVDGKEVAYLVLEPVGQTGSRYLVPTHNEVAMGKLKKMLTREEMEKLLGSEEIRKNSWNPDESLRKQAYRELISSGDREQLMAMVHTLYVHKAEQAAAGRKIHLCDENFLRDAEKLLAGEIAVVMDQEVGQAVQYLRQNLK